MLICCADEQVYAKILRQVKADPSLIDYGESVTRIRRTQKKSCGLHLKTGSTAQSSVVPAAS